MIIKMKPFMQVNCFLFNLLIILIVILSSVRAQTNPTFGLVHSIPTTNVVSALKYLPDGKTIAYTEQSIGLTILNATDYTRIALSQTDFLGGQTAMAFTFCRLNQSRLYYHMFKYAYNKTRPVYWSNTTLTLGQPMALSSLTYIYTMDISHDDTMLIRCGYYGFQIVSLNNGSIIHSRVLNYGIVSMCRFSPNSNHYAVVRNRLQVQVFNQNNIRIAFYPGGNLGDNWIYGMKFNADGTLVAFIQHYRGLIILNTSSNSRTNYYNVSNTSQLLDLDWSPNYQKIAFTIRTNKTVIINVTSKEVLHEMPGSSIRLSFSPNSLYLAESRLQQKKINIYGPTCPNGSYLLNHTICLGCPNPCATCSSPTKCHSCHYGLNIQGETCNIENCGFGKYGVLDQCFPCKKGCLSCEKGTCFSCKPGFEIKDGCTEVIGCVQLEDSYLNTSNNCQTCDESKGFVKNEAKKTCECPLGTYLSNKICHKIMGCIAPIMINETMKCQVCNNEANFQLIEKNCACKNGFFSDTKTETCIQICGDEVLYDYQCDDGNNIDSDGCSSDCKEEKNYKCTRNQTHKSMCFLTSKDLLQLQLFQINRIDFQNRGIFKLIFLPKLFFIPHSFITDFSLQEQSIQNISWKLDKGQLLIEFQYNQTMENREVKLSLNLHDAYYRGPIFYEKTFLAQGNDRKLLYSTKEQIDFMFLVRYIIIFAVPAFLLVYIACSSVHKLAGSEFIHTYLIMIYLFIIRFGILPFNSFLQLLSYANLPFLSFILDYSNKNIDHKLLQSIFTSIIYYILVILVAVIYTLTKIFEKLRDSQENIVDFLLFNKILFPITLTFFFEIHSATATLLNLNLQTNLFSIKILVSLSILFYMFAIIILAMQFTSLFFDKIWKHFCYVGLKNVKKGYVPSYISCYLAISIFLGLSKQYSFTLYKQFLFAFILSMLCLFIKKWPYRYIVHNLTVIFNIIILLIYLGFMIVQQHMPWTVAEFAYFAFLVFMFSLLVVLNVGFNIFRVFCTIKQICQQRNHQRIKKIKQSEKIQKKQQSKLIHKYLCQNSEIPEIKHPLIRIPRALTSNLSTISVQHAAHIKNLRQINKKMQKYKMNEQYYQDLSQCSKDIKNI